MTWLVKLLGILIERGGSDLHLKMGRKPVLRVGKDLVEVSDWDGPVSREMLEECLGSVMQPFQRDLFRENKELDFAYEHPDVGRFRVNAFLQRGNPGFVFRRIKSSIPTFAQLNLPPVLSQISSFGDGLVLVTGPTGCGKSTTLAAMIEFVNENKVRHIVTIEDPIEFLYTDRRCVIDQREVGIDTVSFAEALKHVLRQDPDVILVGEMRDVETFEAGINACETGHLVFGTLHTVDTVTTITRILDFFPPAEHDQVRKIIAYHLRATVCQKLVPGKDGSTMLPICEVMVVTPIISKLIADNRLNKIPAAMNADKELGMQTFNQHLVRLIQQDLITRDVGFSVSPAPHTLEMNLRGIYLDEDSKIVGE